jgi:1-aminocyclopropane-1-carboxylate deaminase/D-cysteine desulfhydrase-like pyridoxal-dependent ACC family enzyme
MAFSIKKPLLFKIFPELEGKIPWVNLELLKTPVKQLINLQNYLGINSIWVKQDDLSSEIYGGNKPRKLEFLLADAINKGCKKILTVGGIGSNHCVATAAFCNKLNLKPYVALMDQPITPHVKENLLLELYFKSNIIYAHTFKSLESKIFRKLKTTRKIYFIGSGGSNPLGVLGFVNAVFELKSQIDNSELPEPDYLFVANGSMGTTAGLSLGIKLVGLKSIIHSIRVTSADFANLKNTQNLAIQSWELISNYVKNLPNLTFEHLIVNGDYYGEYYGKPTREALEAIKLLNEKENIKLESTYTGKTFAALLDFVKKNKTKLNDKTILFWNTYNSQDYSQIVAKMDYHNLPKKLHWIFQQNNNDINIESS